MPFTKKLALYAIGFALGLGLLWGISLKKRRAVSSKPYYCRPLHPKDLHSKRPVDPFLAFYYTESCKPYGLKRVLVYDRVGPSGFIRVEEKLNPGPQLDLISRKVYLANRLRLTLKKDPADPAVADLLERLRLRIIEGHPSKNCYTVELVSPSIPMYHKSRQALLREPLVASCQAIAFPLSDE
jgi:hypothetical protein